ncbi:MAG: hypothetical protein R3242_02650, partial [Akkermansiaceae bacterium]|nr:hypothetical protein [Akkermansiaceae bacterium]
LSLNVLEQDYINACVDLRERQIAEKEAAQQRELARARQLAAEQRKLAERAKPLRLRLIDALKDTLNSAL